MQDLDRLAAWLDAFYRGARAIYVGRTNHPQRRLLEHALEPAGHTHLSALWWSDDWQAVAAMEQALVAHLLGRGKSGNIDRQSDGQWRGASNCIYVSWTPKNAVRLTAPTQTVDRLVSQPSRHADLSEPVHYTLGDTLLANRKVNRAAITAELDRWAARPPYKPPQGRKASL